MIMAAAMCVRLPIGVIHTTFNAAALFLRAQSLNPFYAEQLKRQLQINFKKVFTFAILYDIMRFAMPVSRVTE